MLISTAWINELISAKGETQVEGRQLAKLLTGLGLEVEGITSYGQGLESVVVAEVRSVSAHPQADKLSVVELDDGQGVHRIVCGASNVPAAGGKIAFARVGTTLPGGLVIAARKVRGVDSAGMICSAAELDIGTDEDGILVLPADWRAGTRLDELVPSMRDTILELSVTPNRPDALGHLGVARDIAVKLGRQLRLPATDRLELPANSQLVELAAPDRCGRYFGTAFDGFEVRRSPLWMSVRLHRLGRRALSNAVDITNYVQLETGQPLHVFDRDRLAGQRLHVRLAKADEPLTTLDGTELKLDADDLVIADADVPQALAGVMGGESSMVTASSRRVLLEAAWFEPGAVRRSAKRHQLHTDSSHRFERGMDHGEGLELAWRRAATLLMQLGGGRCVAHHEANGDRPPVPEIQLRPARVGALLGAPVDAHESEAILRALGVAVEARPGATAWSCRPPTFRPDLHREVDLIEEVLRVVGFERIPDTSSRVGRVAPLVDESAEARRLLLRRLRAAASEARLHECVTLTFDSADDAQAFLPTIAREPVHLANPMRVQAAALRTHLLPGLLQVARTNRARHGYALRLFELGRTYHWPQQPPIGSGPTADIDRQLPVEHTRCGVLLCEPTSQASDLGQVLCRVVARLGLTPSIRAIESAQADEPHLHPGVRASIVLFHEGRETVVGTFGEVHPDLVTRWELGGRGRCYYGELDVEALPVDVVPRYTDLPRFPATSRDVSFDMATSWPVSELVRVVERTEVSLRANGELGLDVGDTSRERIEFVEDYRSAELGQGRRAVLLRLWYRARGRSLTDTEVQAFHDRLVEAVCREIPDVRVR